MVLYFYDNYFYIVLYWDFILQNFCDFWVFRDKYIQYNCLSCEGWFNYTNITYTNEVTVIDNSKHPNIFFIVIENK